MKTTIQKKPTRREVLERAFADVNLKDLAAQLGTSVGVIYNIKYGLRQVSAVRAIRIEHETDKMGHKVPRSILRPDVFGDYA